MINPNGYSLHRPILSDASVRSAYNSNASRVDMALLASALFLQRFAVPYGDTFVQAELLTMGLILLYQFLIGKLLISSDRLLWFLGLALVLTCSLMINFKATMLTGYLQFMIFFLLFTLKRPSTPDQYKGTLHSFQFLIMVLSCLAIVQLAAGVLGDRDRFTNFYGIFPDFLLGRAQVDHHEFDGGSFRSNGLFLAEPSFLSQMTALGILIEILEFRRPRYLFMIMLGFLLSYSGTGLILLLVFLPLAALSHGRAGVSALLVILFALGLVATGIIDPSAFTSRVGEFGDAGTSGFSRFVAPFWLAAQQFQTESLQALLLGHGPGTAKVIVAEAWYTGDFAETWIKIFDEYGIIGSFILCCFLASCLRRSRCPPLVIAAIIFAWIFLQGLMTIAIALCTLNGPGPRHGRKDQLNQSQSALAAGSAPD
jgi:hypothetical protein